MAVGLRTQLCDKLGIDVPILSAGMGSVAGPDLVAAVSEAGGFGVLGVSGASPEGIQERIGSTRALTRRPFGVNVIIDEVGWASSEEDREQVRAEVVRAIDEQVAAVVLFWGDPAPFVDLAHRKGVVLLVQVGSVAEAETAAAAGVDAVIAQGVEAGGHVRGTSSIWELLPAVVATVSPLPVLGSGGIGDGAGVARAMSRGLTRSTSAASSRVSRKTPSTLRISTTSRGPGPRPARFAIGPSTSGMPQDAHHRDIVQARGRSSA